MSAANLQIAIDALDSLVAGEMTRQAAIVAAGDPAPVSYSAGGVSMDLNEWLKNMAEARAVLVQQQQAAAGPWEYVTRGYPG